MQELVNKEQKLKEQQYGIISNRTDGAGTSFASEEGARDEGGSVEGDTIYSKRILGTPETTSGSSPSEREVEQENPRVSIPARTATTGTQQENSVGLRSEQGRDGLPANGGQKLIPTKWVAFEFDNPAEMYAFYTEDIRLGRKFFHKWQAEENLRVAGVYTKEKPLKLVLNANNGSGKDSFFISPVAVWLAATKIRHKVVITSKSYKQISNQTEPYIVAYCNRVNEQEGQIIFDIKQGLIKCVPTGSEIKLFVSDDPNNIEGEHPFDDYLDAEMTVIINEAKGIPRLLFQAFSRWTGYSRWLEVSSSGKTDGHMYDAYCMSIPYPLQQQEGKWYSRKITVYECPHLNMNDMEEDKILCGGETSEFFRSKYLSEFTSIDESVVVSKDKVDECLRNPPAWDNDNRIVGGLDISGGRDETCCASRSGNKMLKLDAFRIKEAPILIKHLDENIFPAHGFIKYQTPIYCDAGGMGEPIVDLLKAMGWNVIPVLNQHVAANKKLYKNRGTNNWFNFGNAVKLRDVILLPDDKFLKQLSNRGYDLPDNDRLQLLSKQEERANGKESPDRADAVVLSFCGFEISSKTKIRELKKVNSSNNKESLSSITQSELVTHMADRKFSGFEGLDGRKKEQVITNNRFRDGEFFTQRSYIEESLKAYNTKISNN